MKKFIIPILLLITLIPLLTKAETCDIDKISITSITIEDKSDNVKELTEATVNGKAIDLDLSMSEVGDNIKYKLIVKNESNEDYELDKNSFVINSDYIDYTLESEDDSNIIKANLSKTVYLKVEYKNEVPDEQFESGAFHDNKILTLQLSSNNISDDLKNPYTSIQLYFLLFIVLVLMMGTIYVLLKKKKYTKYMIMIIGIMIPISVYAICKTEIIIDSNVKIEKEYETTYIYSVPDESNKFIENNPIPDNASTYESFNALLEDTEFIICLKLGIKNNKIIESYPVLHLGNGVGEIRGGGATFDSLTNEYNDDSPYYLSNKNTLKTIFGESNCSEEIDESYKKYECSKNEDGYTPTTAKIDTKGYASFSWIYGCQVFANGESWCY